MIYKEHLYKGRILSIDTFRGITILTMIFVNEVAGVKNIPDWLKHVPGHADAMTFVDVVFPAFLFIVGMSIPFSFNARLIKGDSNATIWKHTLMRFFALIIMGLFMVNASYGYDLSKMLISKSLWGLLAYSLPILVWNQYHKKIPSSIKWILIGVGILGYLTLYFLYVQEGNGEIGITIKWWGILGLIGWAYLINVVGYWITNGKLIPLFVLIGISILINTLNTAGFSEIRGLGWLAIVGGHFGHASITMAGLITSLLFFDSTKKKSINWQVVGFCIILFLIGFVLRPYFEVSKVRATPSWCLYSASWCIAIYYLFYHLIEEKNLKKWTSFFMPAASNPLLIYILPSIFSYTTSLIMIDLTPEMASSGMLGIIWSMLYALFMMVLVKICNKYHIRLHL